MSLTSIPIPHRYVMVDLLWKPTRHSFLYRVQSRGHYNIFITAEKNQRRRLFATMSENDVKIQQDPASSGLLKGYEKLRNVGKGAFGVAVLYRRQSDDTLVVIKEINMLELTAAERQLALNEVQVLRIMNHPNIISYYRSFERDGMLLIEMEYADGGTLAQFLSHQVQPLKEIEILYMFQQIVSAIKYMHSFNVLHRDLKTANVFLTKEKVMKVGDFGISKIVTTLAQAHSVLGTPYYISPEMCEGKEYNEKSDIWSLGCVLYEMACLHKTFDGANLPALVNKIMKGHFQPVPLEYSPGLRQLIYELLQKDPQARPTAGEILDVRLQKLLNNKTNLENGDHLLERESLVTLQSSFGRSGKIERSVLYKMVCFELTTSLLPVPLPPKYKIREIAVSSTHFIALTTELMVYTWGEGGKGQLGHGEVVPWQGTPQPVEALNDKNIKMIAAGDGFSVFVSESGMLMTCGDGSFGCLGHGDWNNVSRPKLIEKLLSVDITAISCGDQHVTALSVEGDMYSWGRGQGGRLGLGNEESSCLPSAVSVPNQQILRNVRCGGDATMAITSDGALLACGNNAYNKLGLSRRRHFLRLTIENVEKSLTLTRVTCVSSKVADVSLGHNHTTILTERGRVITMGRNAEGQLGTNDRKNSSSPVLVKGIADKQVIMVKSGSTFSIAATSENEIYFWGTRYERYNVSEILSSGTRSQFKSEDSSVSPLQNERPGVLISEPTEILALYASPQQIEKGETVGLAGIYAAQNTIMVLVDTTVPLVSKQNISKVKRFVIEESECAEDVDSFGPVPNWIKDELALSQKK